MPFRRRAGFERCASSAKNSVPAVLSSTSARSTTLPATRPLVPPDSAHRRQRAPGNHCQPSTARLRRVGDSDDDPTHRLQTKKAGTPDRPQGPTGKACQRPQGHPDSHPATRTAQRASRTGRPQAMTRPRRWEESGERPRTECRTSGRGRSRPPNSVVNPKSTRRALKRRGCRGRRFHPGGTWALPHPSVSPTGTALPSESTRQTKDVPLSSAPWPSVRLCASNSSSSVSPGTSIPTRTPGTGRSPFVEHYALQLRADRSGAQRSGGPSRQLQGLVSEPFPSRSRPQTKALRPEPLCAAQ